MATRHSLGFKPSPCTCVFKHLDPAHGIPVKSCVATKAEVVADRTGCVPGVQPSRVVAWNCGFLYYMRLCCMCQPAWSEQPLPPCLFYTTGCIPVPWATSLLSHFCHFFGLSDERKVTKTENWYPKQSCCCNISMWFSGLWTWFAVGLKQWARDATEVCVLVIWPFFLLGFLPFVVLFELFIYCEYQFCISIFVSVILPDLRLFF